MSNVDSDYYSLLSWVYKGCLFVGQKMKKKYWKITVVADLGVRPKCPHFLGFIFIENMFLHREKKWMFIKITT